MKTVGAKVSILTRYVKLKETYVFNIVPCEIYMHMSQCMSFPTMCHFGLNNIYSDKVHDIHKYNVKIVGSDSKPVAYLDHLLDML